MRSVGDIDIDVGDSKEVLERVSDGLGVTRASLITENSISPHPSGVYMVKVPIDPISNLSSIDYKVLDEAGVQKVDLLTNRVFRDVSPEETRRFVDEILPDVNFGILLDDRCFVGSDKIPHLGNYRDLVQEYQPKSIEEVAILIAMIRPAKRHLIGMDLSQVTDSFWENTGEQYHFKKSHAIGYAILCVFAAYKIISNGE